MAVTMKQVRAVLDPEEPDYQKAARLGADALPHLEALVGAGDTMLASKAAYAASLIKDERAEAVVRMAAQSADPAVRVAAAAAAANMPTAESSNVLLELVGDPDPGVRKVARQAVPEKASTDLRRRLDELGDDSEPDAGADGTLPPVQGQQAMPGEMPGGGEQGRMPGEGTGRMPGEQERMPGE